MGNMIDTYINNLNKTPAVTPQESPAMRGETTTPIPAVKPDTLAFLEMYSDLKENKELSNEAQGILEGKINNKNTVIKTVPTILPDGRKISYDEGYVGDNQLQLKAELINDENNQRWHYTGQFGNKNVDLMVDIPKEPNKLKRFWNRKICNKLYVPDNITIKGEFGGSPYELKIPDAKVPRDSDEKDFLTLMMDRHCFQLGIAQGNIVSIEPGKYRIKGWERKNEKRNEFFKENIKPLINQTLSTITGIVVGIAVGKIGLKK